MRPIPTTYCGIRFRSRLEADAAQLLTLIRAEWVYEPESFLLTCGEHYRPDFWLPGLATWFEVRGYESERGRTQIVGFAEEIRCGRIRGAYCTLDLSGASWSAREGAGGVAVALQCDDCGQWGLGCEDQLRCRACGRYRNRGNVWDLRIAEARLRLSDFVAPWLTPVEFARHTGLARPEAHGFSRVGELLSQSGVIPERPSVERRVPSARRRLPQSAPAPRSRERRDSANRIQREQ